MFLYTPAMTGEPALLIDLKAKVLRKAMVGVYCYKRVRVANDERYQDKPEKKTIPMSPMPSSIALMGGARVS